MQPNLITPTPPPTSGVVATTGQNAMPAKGTRRVLVGWAANLVQVLPDVVTFDDTSARAAHAAHAKTISAVDALPPFAPNVQLLPLSQDESAWAQQIMSTPDFLNAFGPRARVGHVALDQLVVWQPFVDAVRDDAQPLGTSDEIIRAMLPERAATMPFRTTLSRDAKGVIHALLAAPDPSHDLDITAADGTTVTVRLRPRVNVVHGVILNNRLVILNGYHRLVRLAVGGARTAPIVIVDGVQLSDRPGFLPLALVMSHPRPPVINDFTNAAVSFDVPRPDVMRGHDVAFTYTELPIRVA